ncbi:MAG: DUF1610 domain-containing protein [Thermoplasmata archaeon]|nr:DUF1610 domain-containing protein [Thermoplasmata archaeon]NIS13283.1 DUF1610 domain-containing protein [Thermoplasmata archaeon]NIS21178.1 DUF1610 domain-containing protein [Thermoplasmata archaeon]NIT78665.1 DUF1610 domain-containing protein [Thermoplasmata archaeon]NIU50236.1 DUF1610 domain-containing protein [Thermoplasmata archaeon]
MEIASRCTSCGVPLTEQGRASFNCPQCGNVEMGRCNQCRGQGVQYACPECGFIGP